MLAVATVSLASYVVIVADSVPAFDLKLACRGAEAAGIAGRTSQMCIESEEGARDQLKKSWPEFTAVDKADCMRMVRIGVPPSYAALISCLETKRDVRELYETPAGMEGGDSNGSRPKRR